MTLPVLLQSNSTECGVACIAMIANAHGRTCSITQLRREIGYAAVGNSLRALIDIARNIQLHARPLRLEPEEAHQLRTPCVLLWGTQHFVVLKKVTARGWHLHDPATGARFYRHHEVHALFGGIALELTPGADRWQSAAPPRVRLSDIWAQSSGVAGPLIAIIALSIALQCVALVSPMYVQLVVDDALVRSDVDLLAVLGIAFAGLSVIGTTVGHLRSVLSLRLGASLNEQLSANLCAHLLRLPLLFFVHRDIGDINARFGSLAPVLKLLTAGIAAVVIDGLLAITTLALLFVYQPTLTLTVLAFLLAALVLQLGTLPRLQVLTNDGIRRSAAEQTVFIESLRSILSLKANGMESARSDLWRRFHTDSVDAGSTLGLFGLRLDLARGLLTGIENILVVYLGARSVIESEFTIGMLYAFIAYKSHFVRAASALIEQMVEIRMLRLHLERLADIALEAPDSTQSVEGLVHAPLRGGIALRNVCFGYRKGQPPILSDASCNIVPGADVAVLGASGSGKSTFLKILLGLIKPDSGEILFDHVRSVANCRAAVQSSVGVVLQGDSVFTGTIRDNVALFDLQPDDVRIARVCEIACIQSEIEALPLGYDTPLGDMGIALSAGQVQRLLLARALYKNPRLLLLDEATANLDDATRAAVNANLRGLGLTIVRVTHRPDEISSCDAVYRLSDGALQRVAIDHPASAQSP